MNRKRLAKVAVIGGAVAFVLMIVAIIVFSFLGQSGGRRTASNASGAEQADAAPQEKELSNAERLLMSLAPNNGGETALGQSSPDTAGAQASKPYPQNFTQLYDIANPGVVNIEVIVQQGATLGEGIGSGFVYDNQGHIVTNNHVIAGAQQVIVTYSTGVQTLATIVGTDPDTDLAVIRVENLPKEATPLALGDLSSVQVGDWVVAIGSPFGLGSSMTAGIVSAVGRTIPAGSVPFGIPEAIQTDAAINPGNSGGPLLNTQGQVIGVNAQIVTESQTASSAGVGFAIPVNIVKRVVPVLIDTGTYQHPYLGIEGASMNLLLAEANNLSVQQGIYVDSVIPDGPAAQAGLQGSTGTVDISGLTVPVGGDVIVQAGGQAVNNYTELLSIIESQKPSDQLTLTILRDGQSRQVTVVLTARPAGSNG